MAGDGVRVGRARAKISYRLWNAVACPTPLRAIIAAIAAATISASTSAADTLAASARSVLETHCARCHQAGRLENPPAKGNLGNILDLDALRAREDLIVPADPDASRLYQIMLARHRPLSVFFGPVPGPTAPEIGAVRDWLSAQPAAADACAGKSRVTLSGIKNDMAAWRKVFEPDATKPLRFISLANLHNLCRSDAQLAAYRQAVAILLARLTRHTISGLDTVGDDSVLLAFRPDDLGLTAEAWDLRAGPGDPLPDVVDAEVLAARALSAGTMAATVTAPAPVAGTIARANASPTETALIDGLDPVDALALEHTRRVLPARAAAELHLSVDQLRDRIRFLSEDEAIPGVRLFQSGLPRAEWETLKAHIAGRQRPKPIETTATQAAMDLHLALWTETTTYKAGDILTLYALPSADCHLTIVAVEAGGLATVLFPNDTATDNKIKGGTTLQLPPPSAPFQFRLDKPGRHGLVAICNAVAKRPQGIGHDFERQRFTVLGDWRTFLIETAEREAAYQKTQDDLRKFRTGAGRAETLEEQIPLGTDAETRAAISLDVAP
jgi:hypothetical protein